MAQTWTATKPESGVTTFGELYQIIRDHNASLRSSFSGTSFPSIPVSGQLCWRTDRGTDGYLYVYTGNTAVGESGWVSTTQATAIGLEVINARGSKSSLDQRLDVIMNEDGTLKDSVTINYSQWKLPAFTFTYTSSTTFTVENDQTDIYSVGRRLKINLDASYAFSEVQSAIYNGSTLTTITITDAVLDNTLVSVEHSLIDTIDNNGAVSAKMVGAYSKSEVDNNFVDKTTAQVIGGIKTFTSFPITPSSAPTTDYQVANKKYVDDNAGIQIATAAEIRTGTDNTKAISPLGYNQTTLGQGQTWQDVTSSRTAGVTYTNSTGKPIQLGITTNSGSSGTITINGVVAGRVADADNLFCIVPVDAAYVLQSGTPINTWAELR